MSPIIWQKIIAAAAAAGIAERELYGNRSLRTKFAAEVGSRGGRRTAENGGKRRRRKAEAVNTQFVLMAERRRRFCHRRARRRSKRQTPSFSWETDNENDSSVTGPGGPG